MKKALSHRRPPRLIKDAGHCDPERVREDGERYGGQNKHDFFPQAGFVKISQKQAHYDERKKVPQSAAGIHHLQLGETKVYDIALTEG